MIDEYPILAVAAAFASGTTRMRGLAANCGSRNPTGWRPCWPGSQAAGVDGGASKATT